MTTAAEIEIALQEWKDLEIVDTWDKPADDPAYIAKCEAYARYMALALEPIHATPQTPLLPATCPTPETGRGAGVIGYASRDYGYISVEGEDDVKFYTRHLFGRIPMKGDNVTFTRGIAGNAIDVVLSDAATSREAYSAKMAARPAMPRVRPARANFNEGFQFTENAEELAAAREVVRKLREGLK